LAINIDVYAIMFNYLKYGLIFFFTKVIVLFTMRSGGKKGRMRIIKLIFFMILVMPLMLLLSGCFDDSILDAMISEGDFVAPFDVVVTLDKTRRSVYFPIADTGRLDIVKPGDDATYTDVPDAPDFEIQLDVTLPDDTFSDNDIVIDKVTGLVWTRCSISGINTVNSHNDCVGVNAAIEWANAVTSCEALNDVNDGQGYAGYKNWRLPRLPELLSIVDYEEINPAVDESLFPNIEHATDEGYWTYTSQLFIDDDNNTTDNGWIVFFNSEVPQTGLYDGAVFEIPNITVFKRKLKSDLTFEKQFARCVTGGAD